MGIKEETRETRSKEFNFLAQPPPPFPPTTHDLIMAVNEKCNEQEVVSLGVVIKIIFVMLEMGIGMVKVVILNL